MPQRNLRSTRSAKSRRLAVESLAARIVPTVNSWPGIDHPMVEVEGNNTLDVANELGHLGVGQKAGVVGEIGNGAAWSTDVDWYHFTLDHAARVQIRSLLGSTGTSSPI